MAAAATLKDCWDSVVVGGGPAGCAAAYDLAKKGYRVVILDRRNFPREKACAGGLTVKALNRLRYSIAPVIERVCSEVRLARDHDRSVLARSSRPVVAMTQRSKLDEFCLLETRAAGAEFRKIRSIGDIEEMESEVRVDTDQGPIRGRFLIGADGASSSIRKRIWPPERRATNGFAIEACFQSAQVDSYPMEFEFGVVQGGYGWIFPKGDHLNVGVYSYLPEVRIDRQVLTGFVEKRFRSGEVGNPERVIGSPIGLVRSGEWPVTRRVTLVGDAAQAVDPLLGEGIHYALWSGQEAAAAVDRELTGQGTFLAEMRRRGEAIRSDLKTNWRFANLFYSQLDLGYGLLRAAPVRNGLLESFAKGWTLSQAKNRILVAPLIKGKSPDYLRP